MLMTSWHAWGQDPPTQMQYMRFCEDSRRPDRTLFSGTGRVSVSVATPSKYSCYTSESVRPNAAIHEPVSHPTFKHAAQTVIKEAIQLVNESPAAGPGSEYANAVVPGGRGEVNPVTGLRKTRNNPSGTPCSTPICLGRKRVDHDWNNCFQAGGGRAGQAPWQKGKGGVTAGTPQVAAVAGSTPIAAVAIQCPPTNDYFRDLSCHATMASSTILDSGTTTHLIRDPSLFWTFTHDSTVSMKTANQGSLNTEGYGDCVAVRTPSLIFCPLVAWLNADGSCDLRENRAGAS